MAKTDLIRILVKGGILTPGYFLKIIGTAKKSGDQSLKFGSRQDILFEVKKDKKIETEISMVEAGIGYEWKGSKENRKQNIVTSFVTSGILDSTSWVTEGTYLKILDGFKFEPQIKVNIVDSKQTLQPLFNGLLNFISSETQDYWYLFFNESGQLAKLPFLVNSLEIPEVSLFCEKWILEHKGFSVSDLLEELKQKKDLKKGDASEKMQLPSDFFPYYEGIEKMRNGKNYWAGFYWRNNNYSIEFIEKVCKLCLKTGIAKISITPWKTFLIKDIKQEDLVYWEQLIGRMGINMRHSSFELNWHLSVTDNSILDLKKRIVRAFDKIDVRTFGLTFSITEKGQPAIYTSVRIIKHPKLKFLGRFDPFTSYTVETAKNYDPNSLDYRTYVENLSMKELMGVLVEISKKYYLSLSLKKTVKTKTIEKKKIEIKTIEVYQCKNCHSIYSEKFGDESNNIEPGTAFNSLPENYCCPTCESTKDAFVRKNMNESYLIMN